MVFPPSGILPQVAQAHYPTKLINIIHTSTTYKTLYENYPITLKLSEFWQVNDGKCALFIRTSVSGGIYRY